MDKLKLYLAHPISGMSADEVFSYYNMMTNMLDCYAILSPMIGKEHLRTEKEFKAHSYQHPVSTNKAILGRDSWMVRTCDVLYLDLMDATSISIGCTSELAWAWMLGKHTVISMQQDNVHQHAFILEMGNIVFSTRMEAVEYLVKLGATYIGKNA